MQPMNARGGSALRPALMLLLVLAACLPAGAAPAAREPLTLVLGALRAEVELLQGQMQGVETHEILGLKCASGRLAGRRVVLARSGVGKVNAAVATALLLERFRPTEVIFTGVAGGVRDDLDPGDIVIGERLAQHDYGVTNPAGFAWEATPNPITGGKNPRFFVGDPRLAALAETAAREVPWEKLKTSEGERTPKVVRGTIVTGDTFVASPAKVAELRERFNADAVEMEGAAVAQVCHQSGVPCLVIRCVSDKADAVAVETFERFLRAAAANSSLLTRRMLELLAKEPAG